MVPGWCPVGARLVPGWCPVGAKYRRLQQPLSLPRRLQLPNIGAHSNSWEGQRATSTGIPGTLDQLQTSSLGTYPPAKAWHETTSSSPQSTGAEQLDRGYRNNDLVARGSGRVRWRCPVSPRQQSVCQPCKGKRCSHCRHTGSCRDVGRARAPLAVCPHRESPECGKACTCAGLESPECGKHAPCACILSS